LPQGRSCTPPGSAANACWRCGTRSRVSRSRRWCADVGVPSIGAVQVAHSAGFPVALPAGAPRSAIPYFSDRRPFVQIDCSRLRKRWHAVSSQARRCEWRFAHRGVSRHRAREGIKTQVGSQIRAPVSISRGSSSAPTESWKADRPPGVPQDGSYSLG
jgi:hypothetical protein